MLFRSTRVNLDFGSLASARMAFWELDFWIGRTLLFVVRMYSSPPLDVHSINSTTVLCKQYSGCMPKVPNVSYFLEYPPGNT